MEHALALVDDGGTTGFADLTLARVAARAGVATPSLYKHVGSLDDLRRGVALVAVRELGRACAAATVGRSGPDALRSLARAIRGYAVAHPGRYAATQVAPDPSSADDLELSAAGADVVAIVAATLRGFDLDEARTVDVVRAVRSGVHGFVSLELGGGFGLPDDVDASYDVLVEILVDGLEGLAAAATTPAAS
ncbi:TetR-like C-terminal domain-containing protein [Luteimicrobium sp. NPDC057192]|uniref:TetR-like C-terminal domain-containing protein n=1 Tax=Luteimicrobium sp. NPDC057192 TaxID=3346042 RepID=UPI00362CB89F